MSDYTPKSGRMLGEDGQVYNVVDLLGGGTPVSDEVYDIEQYTPASGDVIGEDGQVYNLVDLLQSVAAGEVVKNAVESVEPIDDPSSATPEDIATAFNNLLAALKG